MATAVDLDKMSTDEKLRLLEAVWQNLSRSPETVPAPAWHGDVLKERDRRLRRGESRLRDWSDAKRRIRERLE